MLEFTYPRVLVVQDPEGLKARIASAAVCEVRRRLKVRETVWERVSAGSRLAGEVGSSARQPCPCQTSPTGKVEDPSLDRGDSVDGRFPVDQRWQALGK